MDTVIIISDSESSDELKDSPSARTEISPIQKQCMIDLPDYSPYSDMDSEDSDFSRDIKEATIQSIKEFGQPFKCRESSKVSYMMFVSWPKEW